MCRLVEVVVARERRMEPRSWPDAGHRAVDQLSQRPIEAGREADGRGQWREDCTAALCPSGSSSCCGNG